VLGLLVRLPVLFNDLVYDDYTLVTLHPQLADPDFISEIFKRDYGLEFGMRTPHGYYRPLLMLLNWLLFQTAGASPLVYHGTSLLGFGAVVLAVTACFRMLISGPRLAMCAALVFALHPLNTEGVAMFASLPDLVMQGLSACVILLILKSKSSDARPWGTLFAGFALSLTAALLKEVGFIMMGLLALGGFIFMIRSPARPAIAWANPAGILLGLAIAFMLRMQADLGTTSLATLIAPFRTDGASKVWLGLATGLSRFALPREMVTLVDEHATSWTGAAAVAVLAALALILAIIRLLIRGQQPLALTLIWLAASTYSLAIPMAMGLPYADRYFASAPWIALFASTLAPRATALLAQFVPDHNRRWRIAAAFAGGFMALAGARSLTGNFKCQNSAVFWRSFLQDQPHSIYPRVGMAGVAFNDFGDFELAEKLAREVIIMQPNSPSADQMTILIAEIRIVEERFGDALELLEQPDLLRTTDSRLPALRAVALLGMTRRQDAFRVVVDAIERFPTDSNLRLQFVKIALGLEAIPLDQILEQAQECKRLGGDPPSEFLSIQSLTEARAEFDQ